MQDRRYRRPIIAAAIFLLAALAHATAATVPERTTGQATLRDTGVSADGANFGAVSIAGPTSTDALLHIGTLDAASTDPALLIARDLTGGSGNSRAFQDGSKVDRSGNIGYASYDVFPTFVGTSGYDHFVGFQSRPAYASTGTIGKLYGLYTRPDVQSGTVTSNYGVFVQDPIGAGTITTNYGAYVAPQTKGTTNWAFYADGSTPNYLGGTVKIGGTTAVNTNPYVLVAPTVSGVGANARAFSDATIFSRANQGYNSYDAVPNLTGTGPYTIYVAYQSNPIYNSTGTLTNMYGFYTRPTIRTGTVTNNYGFYVKDAASTGTVTNNYGLYIEELTRGGTDYAIFTAGTTPSSFGGTVTTPTLDLSTTALPTCDSTTRGQMRIVEGASGAADVLHVCLKSAADTYSWKATATG